MIIPYQPDSLGPWKQSRIAFEDGRFFKCKVLETLAIMIEKVEVVKWKTEKRKNTKPNILLLVLGFVVGMFTAFLLRNFKTIL